MYKLLPMDIPLLETETLRVFLRRPNPHHTNWWLGYYSTSQKETWNWEEAVEVVCKAAGFSPFHQTVREIDHEKWHPECTEQYYYHCPGTVHVWEMLSLRCSPWSLHFPDASLGDLREIGDTSLEALLGAFPHILEHVEQRPRKFQFS